MLARRAGCLLLLLLGSCPAPEAPASIGFFRAKPLNIAPGESAQLSWEAGGVEGCILSPDVGAVPAVGAKLVTPTTTTQYELTCKGARNRLTVEVTPLVSITSFTASAQQVVEDSAVELRWETAGAKLCTLDPGQLEVPVNGAQVVFPSVSTTYRLTCKGAGPNAFASTDVAVVTATSLDEPTEVVVTPQDGMLQVRWRQSAGSGVIYFAEAPGIEVATLDTLPGRAVFRRVASPFTISGLVNGKTYYLRVAAISGALESTLAAELAGTPEGAGTGGDPYFAEQWHLSNPSNEDINVGPAWASGARGEGVKVAVVDEGVDLAHEDLRQNVLTGRSYDYLGNAPVRLAEHGTCVAGLLAARDLNNLGVRGVAPRAGLMSFNLLQDLTSSNELNAMIRQKDVVGVSNNSWGDAPDNTGLLTFADPLWLRGVQEGATTGRGGKGVVYFWASGNGADPAGGPVDDSNFDAQAASRFVIAVGGVGRDGKRPLYAEGGANVLIVAPTEGNDGVALVTTDITGSDGYNTGWDPAEHPNRDYSSTMNGTSGSTPIAAGVGALVLQARPELSYRDVRRVLALSARKNDPSSPGWSTNGAGLHVHHGYGFGVVDANAAVLLARTITPVGPELTYETPLEQPNQAIPDNDGAGISSPVVISGSGLGRVEVVELELTINHSRSGDLEITLAKDNGAQDLMHPRHGCRDSDTGAAVCSDIDGFVFTSVRHLDEPADGQWTLTVKDRVSGRAGVLVSWKLRVYGRQQ